MPSSGLQLIWIGLPSTDVLGFTHIVPPGRDFGVPRHPLEFRGSVSGKVDVLAPIVANWGGYFDTDPVLSGPGREGLSIWATRPRSKNSRRFGDPDV